MRRVCLCAREVNTKNQPSPMISSLKPNGLHDREPYLTLEMYHPQSERHSEDKILGTLLELKFS